MEFKHLVNIDQYFFYRFDSGVRVLCGIVDGHPRIEDGHGAVTSEILKQDEVIVETMNTKYILGKPATELTPEWEVRLFFSGYDKNKVEFANSKV